jgi:Uma2 family endonuclease
MSPVAQPARSGLTVLPADLLWRLSVEQYHAMIAAGILTENDPVELLAGWLISKMPKNPRHSLSTELTREALAGLVPAEWHVRSQEPITLPDSEPEPDVAVARGDRRRYRDRHPGAGDLALVVEVSDASLERDRTIKKQLYAEAGIETYWILNLQEGLLEEYSEPTQEAGHPDYARRRGYGLTEAVPVRIDGREAGSIAVRELLP